MQIEALSETLIRILKSDTPCVCAIKGPWGVGKTYYVRGLLEKNFKNDKHAYTSVFGKSSLDEIKAEIFIKLSIVKRTIAKLEKLEKFLEKINLSFPGAGIKLSSLISLLSNILPIVYKNSIEGSIIVIDDLERLSENLKLQEFLGMISSLKEEYGCKVVLIFNHDYIKGRGDSIEAYKTFKEKIIDFEFDYNPSVDYNFGLIRNKSKYFTCQIEKFLIKHRINNIRIMYSILNLLNLFGSYLKDLIHDEQNKKLMEEIVEAMMPFIYYKRVEDKNLVDVLNSYSLFLNTELTQIKKGEESEPKHEEDSMGKEKEGEQKHEENFRLLMDLNWSFLNSEVMKPFLEYIQTEIMDEQLLKKIMTSIQDELKERKKLENYRNLDANFEKFLFNMNYKSTDLVESSIKLITEDADIINEIPLSDLYKWFCIYLPGLKNNMKDFYKDYFKRALRNRIEQMYNMYKENEDIEKFKSDVEIHIMTNLVVFPYKVENDIIETIRQIMDEFIQLHYKTREDCDYIKRKLKSENALFDINLRESIKALISDEEKLKNCIKDEEFNRYLVKYLSMEKTISNSPIREIIPRFHEILDKLSENDEELKKKFYFWKLQTSI